MHVGMALEPAIVLGFVSIKIVENDVNLLFLAVPDRIITDITQSFGHQPAIPARGS